MTVSLFTERSRVLPSFAQIACDEYDAAEIEVVFIGATTAPLFERLASVRSSKLMIVESHDYGQYEQDNGVDEYH